MEEALLRVLIEALVRIAEILIDLLKDHLLNKP